MTRFKKVAKYRNRMTRFQVPNADTAGTKKVPNPSSGMYTCMHKVFFEIVTKDRPFSICDVFYNPTGAYVSSY